MSVFLLSGGQDSVTSAAYIIKRFPERQHHFLSFDYGQRHKIELDYACQAAKLLQKYLGDAGDDRDFEIEHHIIKIAHPFEIIGGSALTTPDEEFTSGNTEDPGHLALPSSFVPGRNLLFLSVGLAYAVARNIPFVVAGMCETDFSGYPDCRHTFMTSLQETGACAMQHEQYEPSSILTPMMFIDKAQTFEVSEQLGILASIIIPYTLTDYFGDDKMNSWGRGSGESPACKLRQAGHERWKAGDFEMPPEDLIAHCPINSSHSQLPADTLQTA